MELNWQKSLFSIMVFNMLKELTEEQKEICNTDGKLVVRACPGSGKTFTVAAKAAKLMEEWKYKYQGISILSFTNVAWQEIEKQLKFSFNINTPIRHPHFLRTIDSFINSFIFFPYGHLILECKSRPILVGEPAYPWKLKRSKRDPYQYFDKISYDINGDLNPIAKLDFRFQEFKQNGKPDKNYLNIKRMKEALLRKGYANQSDADYFSMKILERYPSIAKLITLRFPYIIIDEAQDTSEIQMRIIDILIENGLENIILVGDPDQSIFEWNNASPELFNEKIDTWNDITMNQNWRSSKNICQFTYFLSKLKEPSIAANDKVSNHPHIPEISAYETDNADFNDLINRFIEKCVDESVELNHSNVAILARSGNLIKEINSSRNNKLTAENENNFNIWRRESYAKELALVKYYYDNSKFQKSFELLEKTYLSMINDSIYSNYKLSELIEEMGYFNFKEELFNLIKIMPKTDMLIGEWIDEFKDSLKDYQNIPDLINKIEINEECKNLSFENLFGFNDIQNKYNYNLSTVHKVKGETYEAVLLILKKRGAKGGFYKTLLNNNDLYHEELRTVYVGITRPKKVLVLAVPSEHHQDWKNFFSEQKITEQQEIVEEQKTLECYFN